MGNTTKTFQAYAVFVPDIKGLIKEKQWSELKSALRNLNPIDVAGGWKSFTPEEQVMIFNLLSARHAAVVFEELDMDEQRYLLSALNEEGAAEFIEKTDPDAVTHLFRKLPRRLVRTMANLVKVEEMARVLRAASDYPMNTAGALMHTGTIVLSKEMRAFQALETILKVSRAKTQEEGVLATVYVVDAERRLLGGISLQELVSAPRDSLIAEFMKPVQLIKVRSILDQEEVARLFAKYNLVSAPVVDEDDRLVGVVLVDDVLDIIQAEATEDMAKMVGTTSEAVSSKSLWHVSSWRVSWLRSPWLTVTLLGEFLVSLVVRHFEPVLQHYVALASFMPIIAALGGNVGSQSGTIVVRGLATGDLRPGDMRRALARECRVGGMIGLLYGALVGGAAFAMYGTQYGTGFPFVVGGAVLVSILVAASMGGTEPFLLQKVGLDPATATGPLITTVTDFVSITIFFTLAVLWLR